MKKIVGILAVAAMATSMFAADVAAQLKMKANLFDSASKTVLNDPAVAYDQDNTYLKISASGDVAGAEFMLFDADANFHNWALWFKPADALKVTAGIVSTGTISKGTYAWWAQDAKFERVDGFLLEANIDALKIDFLSNGPLINYGAKGYAILGNFWLDAIYNLGNAGTIQAFVSKGATINAYGVGGWDVDNGLAIGFDYDHQPWQQTGFFVDALVNFNSAFKFSEVASQIGGQYINDGLALRLVNLIAYNESFKYGFVAKASYSVEGWMPYVQLLGNEIMGKKLGVNVGCEKSVGSCLINAWFDTTITFAKGSSFTCSIPVELTVGL